MIDEFLCCLYDEICVLFLWNYAQKDQPKKNIGKTSTKQ